MINLPFLSALALASSFVRDLPELLADSNSSLARLVQAELALDPKQDVRQSLCAGRVLAAAHCAHARPEFRAGVARVLRPALADLTEVIRQEWEPVLCGVREHRARFSGAFTRHLPKWVREAGFIPVWETQELKLALLNDPVMLAVWVEAQRDGSRASADGLLKFAVSNSTFVDRVGVFGPRVNVSTVKGVYEYEFLSDLVHSAIQRFGDEEVNVLDTLASTLALPGAEPDFDLERALFDVARAYGGLLERHESVFGDLVQVLRERPEQAGEIRRGTRAKVLSQAKLAGLARQHALPVPEVERVSAALMAAIRGLPLPPCVSAGVALAEETEGDCSSVSSFLGSFLRSCGWGAGMASAGMQVVPGREAFRMEGGKQPMSNLQLSLFNSFSSFGWAA